LLFYKIDKNAGTFVSITDARLSPTLACPAVPLAACVQLHPSTKINKILLPLQRPLRDRKTNSRLYCHSSTNPENPVKIGLEDSEITGLTENEYKNAETEHTARLFK